MNIAVFHNKRIPGLQRLSDLQDEDVLRLVVASEVLPLEEALEREWDTDAHLCMYRIDADPEGEEYVFARANKKGAFVSQLRQAGGRVVVRVLVFDYDLPKSSDGEKQEWSADGLESFLGDLNEAVGNSNLEPTAFYTTLHGARLIYELAGPVEVEDAEAMMAGVMDSFAGHGIELDEACSDWTRLMRLPNVEREGHGKYVSQVITGGPTLAPDDCPRGEVKQSTVRADVHTYVGDMPDPTECLELLEYIGDNGRTYRTEFIKKAKRLLQGREAYDIIFDHAPLVEGDDNWNSTVFKVVGQVVGMVAREPTATPEAVFALLRPAIEQLQDREMRGANETDWYAMAWDHVCRIWDGEQAQIIAEQSELIGRQAEAGRQRSELIEQHRLERPQDVPEDGEEAEAWFSRRLIASTGRSHYVMRPDGSFNLNPCPDSLLIPMIRRLDMADIIPIDEIKGKSVVQRSATSIINDHAVPITAIECSARAKVAFIEGEPGYDKLHIPVHRLNPKLTPGGHFDERVDEWLSALGGDQAELLKEWLSHALEVTRSICALNLYGARGTGKGMLVIGLAECFESGRLNDGRALGKWNAGLLESPIVNCDEGVPNISSDESLAVDQAFRTLVTGGRITIRRMREDPFNADIYPRILFTGNDPNIINSIVGRRDLTDDDAEAIEQRLLSIEVRDGAQRLLTSKGNYSYTNGWVAGESPSHLVLANHILWMYENRETAQTSSGRLLVEGEMKTRLVNDLRLRSKDAEAVLRVLVRLIEMTAGGQTSAKIHIHDSRVWVTAASIVEYAEDSLMAARPNLTMRAAGRVLRHFSISEIEEGTRLEKSTPPGGKRGRWVEVDLGIVYEQALVNGMIVDQVVRLLIGQEGGQETIREIDAL